MNPPVTNSKAHALSSRLAVTGVIGIGKDREEPRKLASWKSPDVLLKATDLGSREHEEMKAKKKSQAEGR